MGEELPTYNSLLRINQARETHVWTRTSSHTPAQEEKSTDKSPRDLSKINNLSSVTDSDQQTLPKAAQGINPFAGAPAVQPQPPPPLWPVTTVSSREKLPFSIKRPLMFHSRRSRARLTRRWAAASGPTQCPLHPKSQSLPLASRRPAAGQEPGTYLGPPCPRLR